MTPETYLRRDIADLRHQPAVLGAPESSGEPRTIPVLGPSPARDRYEVGDVFVHVSYRLDGPGISKVTLMTPETAPGRR